MEALTGLNDEDVFIVTDHAGRDVDGETIFPCNLHGPSGRSPRLVMEAHAHACPPIRSRSTASGRPQSTSYEGGKGFLRNDYRCFSM
jgi:hypothetical protein